MKLATILLLALFLMSTFAMALPITAVRAATTSSATYSPQCPTTGGTLVMSIPVDPSAATSAVTTDVNTAVFTSAIEQGLVTLDSSYNPVPLLAQSWTVAPNGTTITFNLRNNVTWSDGVKFTSADVAYSIMQVDKKYAGFAVASLADVVNVTTPDNYTAVFQLKSPEPYLIPALNSWYSPIVPKHIYYGTNTTSILNNPANDAPIGTGPFIMQSWTHGSSIILVRNPNYWHSGLPCLDQITINIVPTQSNAVIAFQEGQEGYVPWEELSPSSLTTVAAVKGATVVGLTDNVGQTSLFLNNADPIMSNLAVRQAFAMVLDGQIKQEIVKNIYFGAAITSDNPFSRTEPTWYNAKANQSALYPYSVSGANALLTQAGYPPAANGTRFTITLTYMTTQAVFGEIAQLVKSQFAMIGVNTVLDAVDTATYQQIQFANRTVDNWQASISQLGLSIDPAIGVTRTYLASSCVNGLNYACANNYKNSTISALLQQALLDTNTSQRQQLFSEAQTELVQQSPAVWLAQAVNTGVYGNGYVGVVQGTAMSELADYSHTYWTGGQPNPAYTTQTTTSLSSSTTTSSTSQSVTILPITTSSALASSSTTTTIATTTSSVGSTSTTGTSTGTSTSTSSSTSISAVALTGAAIAGVVILTALALGTNRRRRRPDNSSLGPVPSL